MSDYDREVQEALALCKAPGEIKAAVITCLLVLIDQSGSMGTLAKIGGVIEGQNAMLDAFRTTARVLKAGLVIGQWVFGDRPVLLNGFVPLGDPELVRLDRQNYRPNGNTALYDTMVQSMALLRSYAHNAHAEQRRVRSLVAVLSDAEDNVSSLSLERARAEVARLLEQGDCQFLFAVIADSEEEKEQALKTVLSLGLKESDLYTIGSAEQEIRKLFVLYSSRTQDRLGRTF